MLPRVSCGSGGCPTPVSRRASTCGSASTWSMHARNQAVDMIFLVSGDDDLTEAVEEVQGHGIPRDAARRAGQGRPSARGQPAPAP